MRSTSAARADRESRNAVSLRLTYGHEGPQCGHLSAPARACCCKRYTSASRRTAPDRPSQPDLQDESLRWDAVAEEARAFLNGIEGAALIRRQRLALIAGQGYTIGPQLARDPAKA
ncbi:MAG TPA: hypothetical protein VNN25_01440, partial [Thermoanaerobaculia bacterium]|nr:hypothetical protein [Thermoanaerobaculia bacterium]